MAGTVSASKEFNNSLRRARGIATIIELLSAGFKTIRPVADYDSNNFTQVTTSPKALL